MKQELPKPEELIKPYRVTRGDAFRLRDIDPSDTQGLQLKHKAKALLTADIHRISELQQLLYAQREWTLLLIFEGADAAGKNSAIRHTTSGVNPAGCETHSFETPSAEELSHDFLWRAALHLPQRGRIGIFNRSYYDEVLVSRVYPDLLDEQRIPKVLRTDTIWQERFESIQSFERHLSRNGTVICKFLLHISKDEQKRRFLKRLDRTDKHWKFSKDDLRDRERWDEYAKAFEDMVRHTATTYAPWYVIPGDHKWFARLVIAGVMVRTLEQLDLAPPPIKNEKRREFAEARQQLTHE